MRSSCATRDVDPVSEMAIVDTFTRLIFGDQSNFSPREEMIIQTFRSVDNNVLMDSYADMGGYLRNLGVREMIHLVARIREQLADTAQAALTDAVESDAAGMSRSRH